MPYLDYAAHTPMDPEVLSFLKQLYAQAMGNPHNTFHKQGRAAATVIQEAQTHVANMVGAKPGEVLFTSGSTESNNLAIEGFFANQPLPAMALSTQAEHLSVIAPLQRLQANGRAVEFLEVNEAGQLDLQQFEMALKRGATFASILWVNNETGVVQPLETLGQLCKNHGTLLHVDASQAAGRLDTRSLRQHADLISISGHKLGAPTGVGALVGELSKVKPLFFGGQQQNGLRPGTMPTELIAAFGHACWLRTENAELEHTKLSELHQWARTQLGSHGELISPPEAAPGILSVAFQNLEAETLLALLDDVALSTGAACSGKTVNYSHVLAAMKVPPSLGLGSIRVSFTAMASEADISLGIARIGSTVSSLKASLESGHNPTSSNPHFAAAKSAL